MAPKALKGQYVALLVQSLPHCTNSTNPLLRLNSLIQQTDTMYFSTDTGQMDGKESDLCYILKALMLTFLAHVSSESTLACTDVSPITVVIAAPSILTRVGQARLYD